MASGLTGIWWYFFTRSIVQNNFRQQAVVQSRQYAERDIGLEWSERLKHDRRHRVSSHLISWGRGGEAKPRGYRNAERCRFGASPRTQISRCGGDPVLAAVGAK